MIVVGKIFEPDIDDFASRHMLTVALTQHLRRRPVFASDHVGAALAAAAAIDGLEAELRDASSYRYLRSQIENTMADPNDWDRDAAEDSVLADYVRHLAAATHGICLRCGESIMASEIYEDVETNQSGLRFGRYHGRCL